MVLVWLLVLVLLVFLSVRLLSNFKIICFLFLLLFFFLLFRSLAPFSHLFLTRISDCTVDSAASLRLNDLHETDGAAHYAACKEYSNRDECCSEHEPILRILISLFFVTVKRFDWYHTADPVDNDWEHETDANNQVWACRAILKQAANHTDKRGN